MAGVFREEALERRASPEHLDDYIVVSNPSVWIVLAAIVAFLAGVGIWGVFGSIADVQGAAVSVEDGQAYCYVDQSYASDLDAGDAVTVSGVEGKVVAVSSEPVYIGSLSDEEASAIGASGNWAVKASLSINLPDGTYAGKVTLSKFEPMALLFNRS